MFHQFLCLVTPTVSYLSTCIKWQQYLMMPGNSPHQSSSGLKYGIQQFKPVPSDVPTGFGNFSGPPGYTIYAPGIVGSTAGHEGSSRLKYSDGLYVPNSQAETSEIWMNQRDHPNLQSALYYKIPGQIPQVQCTSSRCSIFTYAFCNCESSSFGPCNWW